MIKDYKNFILCLTNLKPKNLKIYELVDSDTQYFPNGVNPKLAPTMMR